MMVPIAIITAALLAQLSWGFNEDPYPFSEVMSGSLPEEPPEDDFEIRRRNNNNFLRFGRSGSHDLDYDEFSEDFARPTRSGKIEKNDHFIRFGRSRQDFLRFGRADKNNNHLRFGRSNKRSKRQAEFKRAGSNFLRFGRNSNFLRFGRNNEDNVEKLPESPLVQLLTQLVENIEKKERSKCSETV